MSCLLIPYPSSQDIRYAHWIKHFAAQLSDYREHYQLDALFVLHVQYLALDFLEMLCYQAQCATESIQQQQLSASSLHDIVSQLTDRKTIIQDEVAKVVTRVEQHPAYLVADGHKLGLPPPGRVSARTEGDEFDRYSN